jgi:cytosine/creatinine deaminase
MKNLPRMVRYMKTLLKNIIHHNRPQDVLMEHGVITKIASNIKDDTADVFEGQGGLLLPTFTDAHLHLDKCRYGMPWAPHEAKNSVQDRIKTEIRMRKKYKHNPVEGAENAIRLLLSQGTTHIRSHVDVTPDVGLDYVNAMLSIRNKYRKYIDIELVAFPQQGILRSPGVAKMLAEAIKKGVDVVGGIDPYQWDNDRKRHIDTVFDIASKAGAKIDIHIHEFGRAGIDSIKAVIRYTKAMGMNGRVALSHCYALGTVKLDIARSIAEGFAEQNIILVSCVTGHMPIIPLPALLKTGMTVALGSDCIRDFWSPYGNGDMLQRAMLLGLQQSYREDAQIESMLKMISTNGENLLSVPTGQILPGSPADLVVLKAPNFLEAVVSTPSRTHVFRKGQLVAKQGECLI